VQIDLTKKKDLRLPQSSHKITPFCGGMCTNTKPKGETLKGQTFSDLFDVSSGRPLSFNPTITNNEDISTLHR